MATPRTKSALEQIADQVAAMQPDRNLQEEQPEGSGLKEGPPSGSKSYPWGSREERLSEKDPI